MIDKVKAIELRMMGYSYSQISKQLDCSEAWCKKNLSDVEKGNIVNIDVETKIKAIQILEAALQQLREM